MMDLNEILHSVNDFLNFDSNNPSNQIKFGDGNLNQGVAFMNFSNASKNRLYPQLSILQATSAPHLGSVIESLESNNSTQTTNTYTPQSVSKYEQEFNKTLAEYSIAYKSLIEDMVKNNSYNVNGKANGTAQGNSNSSQYFGKTVSNSGNYVYINDFGFTHKYSTDSWNKRDASCSGEITNISGDIYSTFNSGPDMGMGQACKIAGQNVKNTVTNEVAWIDIKGYKHVYSQDVWNKKQQTCNIAPIIISNSAYNAIPKGSDMTSTDICSNSGSDTSLNSDLIKKIDSLNAKLIELATKIMNENKQVTTTDKNLQEKLNQQHAILQNNINKLNNDRYQLYSGNTDYTTIQGSEQQSTRYLNYTFYNYLIWLILGVIFIIIVIKIALDVGNSESSQNDTILLFVVILFAFYFLIKWVSNNYY